MGFPGKDELNGAIGIVHHRGEALDVGKNKVSPFISRETACEADGQRVGAEHSREALQHVDGFSSMLRLSHGATANELDELRLEIEVSLPEFAVIDILDSQPGLGLAAALQPVVSKMAVVKAEHLGSQ